MTPSIVEEIVRRTCTEQNVPIFVEDLTVIEAVAAIIARPANGVRRDSPI